MKWRDLLSYDIFNLFTFWATPCTHIQNNQNEMYYMKINKEVSMIVWIALVLLGCVTCTYRKRRSTHAQTMKMKVHFSKRRIFICWPYWVNVNDAWLFCQVQWLLDNYETSEGVSLPRSTLYFHYLRHCQEQNLDPMNPASFGKLIRSVFLGLRTRRLGTR